MNDQNSDDWEFEWDSDIVEYELMVWGEEKPVKVFKFKLDKSDRED